MKNERCGDCRERILNSFIHVNSPHTPYNHNIKMQVKEINYGVAFYSDRGIEVNKNLKKYPWLYDEVIKHEIEHSESKSDLYDLWIDFKDMFYIKKRFMIIGFSIRHPRALIADSPFYFDNGEIKYNLFNIILMLVFLILVGYAMYLKEWFV